MDIVFYIAMTMSAIYAVFHIKDESLWWIGIMLTIPKTIWNLVKILFGR